MEPTPPADEAHDELSESQFNYEMQNNWSMIFTDDNNSTDHDLRSNYSSSVDDAEADNDIDLVSESGIVSETDSDYPAFRLLSSRNTDESSATLKTVREPGADSQELSTATLKNSATENIEGSYHFPDPLSASKQLKKSGDEKKTTQREIPLNAVAKGSNKGMARPQQNRPFLTQLKSYAVYIILGILVLDRSIQLFDLSLPSSKWIFGSKPIPPLVPSIGWSPFQEDDSFNPVTIIRYATKTETYFIPETTTAVETVYETADPTMIPSWALAKQLYANYVCEAKVVGVSILERTNDISEKATQSVKDTLDEIPSWLKTNYDVLKEKFGNVGGELMSSAPSYARDKYTESMTVFSDWTKSAAKAAALIREEGVGPEMKQRLSNAKSEFVSGYKFVKEDGVTFVSTSLQSLYVSSSEVLQESKKKTSAWWNAFDAGIVKFVNDPIWLDINEKVIETTHQMKTLGSKFVSEVQSTVPSPEEMKDNASHLVQSLKTGASQVIVGSEKVMSDLREFAYENAFSKEDTAMLKKAVDRQIDNASRAAWSTWNWFSSPRVAH